MNQPTEDRLKRLEEEQKNLREEVRQLREQITEPIKITRLEIDQGGMNKRLDAVQEDTNVLKIEMQGARADIRVVKANQSDLRGSLEEHGQRLVAIETKQDGHTEVLGQIVNVSEGHTKRFDHIDAAIATKDDVAALKATQAEQGAKLDLILQLLQPKGE
ncbi:MAG TPA: hypothetical protein VN207_01585 [Ktedonobacteraceae bacterium]|nr:hypothetical protein [Ktedonobacteraceae bacterium]